MTHIAAVTTAPPLLQLIDESLTLWLSPNKTFERKNRTRTAKKPRPVRRRPKRREKNVTVVGKSD
jgi:hypothetical protein